jgi:hypothetical protein
MMNHYMCDLNFLGTHIEASVLFLEPGYDMGASAHGTMTEGASYSRTSSSMKTLVHASFIDEGTFHFC